MNNKMQRYEAKRTRVIALLEELELESCYVPARDRIDYSVSHESREKVAEKILSEFGIAKPTMHAIEGEAK